MTESEKLFAWIDQAESTIPNLRRRSEMPAIIRLKCLLFDAYKMAQEARMMETTKYGTIENTTTDAT